MLQTIQAADGNMVVDPAQFMGMQGLDRMSAINGCIPATRPYTPGGVNVPCSSGMGIEKEAEKLERIKKKRDEFQQEKEKVLAS